MSKKPFHIFLTILITLIFGCTENPSLSQNSNPKSNQNSVANPADKLTLQVPKDLVNFPVKWTVTASKTTGLKVGDIITIGFTGKVASDHHLYSCKGKTDDGHNVFNKVTVMTPLPKECKGIEKMGPMIESAKPHDQFDDIIEEYERHFEDGQTVTFSQQFKITGPEVVLASVFTFQVCKADQCKYGDWEVSWKTTAEGSGANSNDSVANGNTPPDTLIVEGPDTTHGKIDTLPPAPTTCQKEVKDTGLECTICASVGMGGEQACNLGALIALFIQAFIFGLFAIFTPCVFPIIPLNVSFFTKQSKTRQQGVRNGIIYSGFIVFIYVVLGLGLTMIFGPTFLYNFSTHWITNVVFFLLLFVFALSFFGWFEITLPASWSTKLDSKSERGGLIGIFFMALTLVVVSFSCTGPIVGSVLIAAAGQGGSCMMMPVVGMMGFSMALSIPFALLSVFPSFINSMPKSGGWLNSVKVVLGFIELAMAMKFLSAADLVMGWHLLDRDIFLGIWIVLFVLLGLYLLGFIRLPHDSPSTSISVPGLMLAICSFSFAMILIPAMFGKSITILEGVIPPITRDTGVNVRGGTAKAECDPFTLNGKICAKEDRKYLKYFADNEKDHAWFYDLCEALEFAKKENKPLFIDFTGHTCANCRKMEQVVFPHPSVEPFFKNEYVLVSLWVDDDNALDEPIILSDGSKIRKIGQLWLNLENKLVKAQAQPYYVLMDNNTQILTAPRGADDFSPATFKTFLESGLVKFKQNHATK